MAFITPNDEEHWLSLRTEDVTSTEAAALFGMSPYLTEFELWHAKREGRRIEIEDNERMKWGRRLEAAIAYGIAEDHGWDARPFKVYGRHDDCPRMGSSFDFEVIDPERGPGILEIKNVDSLQYRRAGWEDEEGAEAPVHIEIQLQHQLEVSGRAWGAIGVLVGGNTPKVFIRERDTDIGESIRNKIAAFWRSIELGIVPEPNFERDAAFIRRMHRDAQPGQFADLTSNNRAEELCARYQAAGEVERQARADKEAALAELLTILGSAEKAETARFRISAGTVGESHVSFTRKPYRNVRITAKK